MSLKAFLVFFVLGFLTLLPSSLLSNQSFSGEVRRVKISPDRKSIVSVGSTGEIIFWEMPSLEDMRELAHA